MRDIKAAASPDALKKGCLECRCPTQAADKAGDENCSPHADREAHAAQGLPVKQSTDKKAEEDSSVTGSVKKKQKTAMQDALPGLQDGNSGGKEAKKAYLVQVTE